jgi:hypothetical protein
MKLISTCSLTAIALMAAPLTAQGILPYLPKKTIMAVSAPDMAMSVAEFQQMPLAKMWAEEEVQTFLADIMEMAQEQMDEQMEQAREMHEGGFLPIDPNELMKIRLNGGTFAVTEMSMAPSNSGGGMQFVSPPKIGIVAHLDFGQSAPTWNMLIQMGLGLMAQEGGDQVVRTESKIGDITIITLSPPEEAGIEMSLNVAMVPNGILIGTLTDDVKSIVTNMINKTPVLSTTPGFALTTKNLDANGAEVMMFMAPDPMMDFAMDAVRSAVEEAGPMNSQRLDVAGVERAMQAMGLNNMGTMAMSSSYIDGKSVTKGFHSTPGNATASTKTVDTKFLKWVPKDAVSFSASTIDISQVYDMALKGLTAYDPNLAKQALSQLAQIEGQLGFTIRGDMFGSIGDHYITWSMPMGTISSAPEVALLLKVNNEEKFISALKNLSALTEGMIEIEEGTKRGVKSYAVHVNSDMSEMPMGINIFEMFQPTFAFKDGYMVLGFSASDVKRVFKRMDRKDNPKGDIRSNKEFMSVAASIPQGVTSLAFKDWKADFESMYQLACGVLAFVPMPEEVPIDMSLLPDSETLTSHLFASVSYTKTDANGTESVDVSPFGPETLLMIGALMGAGAGFAWIMGSNSDF